MSAVTRRKDIHVAVDVELPSNQHNRWTRSQNIDPTEAENRDIAAAQEVVAQIRRHIDGIAGVAVAFDRITECEFCDHLWADAITKAADATPGEPEGMPGCCDKAQEEWWRTNIALWPEAQKHEPWEGLPPGWPWEIEKDAVTA